MVLATDQFGQIWVVDGDHREEMGARHPSPQRFDTFSQLIATI